MNPTKQGLKLIAILPANLLREVLAHESNKTRIETMSHFLSLLESKGVLAHESNKTRIETLTPIPVDLLMELS